MKRSPNCEIGRGGEPSDCVIGCSDTTCCEKSDAGTKAHRCLRQLLKRLDRDPEPGNKCGYCEVTFS